jgi:hypothetical protein
MPTKLYAIPLIVLLLALFGSYFAFLHESETRKRLSTEASAYVTNTNVRRTNDPEDGREKTLDVLATYEYEINGTRYEKSVRLSKFESSRFVPWGNATVCYDPADQNSIQNAELFPKDHVCGN